MDFPRQHGPWQILSRREVYRDPWIDVVRDEVIRPDGKPGSHCVVQITSGVSVVAVDDDGAAYLTEEFHYAVGRVTLEAVSGGIDDGETAEQAAHRELHEEIGVTAETLVDLGLCDPFTSIVTSPTRLFAARGLSFGQPDLEGTESVRCRKVPLDEAIRMVLGGRITHSPTCVLLLKIKLLEAVD
jgi:ADP-ribose pyrophosphatase